MTDIKIGTKIKERYILQEFKGSGSFGEVWQAYDEILNNNVAIKIYISLDPRGIDEFKSEYITTQDISHPNLLTTNYFDVWEQHPFLVMKYCANGSSAQLSGKMDEYDLWHFIHDVASGLRYLHNLPEPIIHQDIKPDNILVDENNNYLITDFGISKKIRSTMRKQSKRAIGAGATSYMGPERFDSDPTPVKASDIWSLGVSIYELATGELPFSGLGGIMLRNGADLPSLDNKWSKDMNMIMQSCLAKDTWDRPTAQQLEEYSDAIIKGKPAKISWAIPTNNSESNISEQNPDSSIISDNSSNDNIKKTNKKGYLLIGAIITILICLFYIWSNNKIQDNQNKERHTNEIIKSKTNNKEEVVEENRKVDSEENRKVDSEENVQNRTNKKTTETEVTISNKETSNTDVNASILKKALDNNDYEQVQKLANQGYTPSYAPLAKYYLSNHDYDTAESYAKKAKAAGFKEGTAIIKTLENLGYYD